MRQIGKLLRRTVCIAGGGGGDTRECEFGDIVIAPATCVRFARLVSLYTALRIATDCRALRLSPSLLPAHTYALYRASLYFILEESIVDTRDSCNAKLSPRGGTVRSRIYRAALPR